MYGPVRTVLWEDGPLRGASYPTLSAQARGSAPRPRLREGRLKGKVCTDSPSLPLDTLC